MSEAPRNVRAPRRPSDERTPRPFGRRSRDDGNTDRMNQDDGHRSFRRDGDSGPSRPRAPRSFRNDRRGFRGSPPFGRTEGDAQRAEGRNDKCRQDARNAECPRPPRREASLGPLCDIDEDILRLIARRARLTAKFPKTNAGDRERELRRHWEDEACKISRDPRLIRQLFSLLQEIEVSEGEFGGEAFNLAPSAAPADVDLALPACGRRTRLFAALAAASGQSLTLKGITLNVPLLECVKVLNQLGADLRWDEFPEAMLVANAKTPATGTALSPLDRVIHIGDDALNLFLAVFTLVTRQARVKLVGESSLRFMNLNALKHFLPILGCRLSGLVPGQDGLPARLESAAVLPNNVQVPADLPDDAVTVMLLLAPFWGHRVTFDLRAHAKSKPVLDEAADILRQAGAVFTRDAAILTVDPAPLALTDAITAEMTPALAYPLLALPAFTGGTTTLRGTWPCTFPGNGAAMDLISSVVRLELKDGLCTASATDAPAATWDFTSMPQMLLGLALALFMNAVAKGLAKPLLPALPTGTDMGLVEDFIAHLGYRLNGRGLSPDTPRQSAFAAPTAWWGIGFAMASFIRRNLKLSNPTLVNLTAPQFWTVFNSLPTPVLARPFEQPLPQDESVRHRRIHSNEYLAEEDLPPALDRIEEDE